MTPRDPRPVRGILPYRPSPWDWPYLLGVGLLMAALIALAVLA